MQPSRTRPPGLALPAVLSLAAALAVAAAPLAAAPQQVERARLRAVHYAAASTSHGFTIDLALHVELALADDLAPRLVLRGGLPREPALLVVGVRPAAAELPAGGTLLVEPAVVFAGTFDADGELRVPLDLAHERFAGAQVFVQAAHVTATLEYQLSPGLELAFAPAEAAEPLPWNGPDLGLLLVHDLQATTPGEGFELLVEAVAPTPGHELVHARSEVDETATRVYLDLHAPGDEQPVPQVLAPLHEHVTLGERPGGRVDVLVRRLRAGSVVSDYELVGTFDTRW